MKPKIGVGAEVIEHWYSLVPSQQFSSKEFYDHIEGGIKSQMVPALDISRVDLSEGGALSDKREYLRMKRERLYFDICAAPVGVNYFFSYRFYVDPPVVRAWEIIVAALVLCVLSGVLIHLAGVILGILIFLAVVAVIIVTMKSAVGESLRDLDKSICEAPIVGSIYERYFRKDTYYRQDMRIAYCSIVSGLVKQEVARITGAKGVELIREFTYSPILHDLYRVKETATARTDSAEPVQA